LAHQYAAAAVEVEAEAEAEVVGFDRTLEPEA
jgi:hypothetical protein